jgi:sulfide:quinone oxidoreductase
VDGVYAVGDVTAVPVAGGKMLPKAGVFAHGEAEVVAQRIASELAGDQPIAKFDGRGGCFLELGAGLAAHAIGDFYHADGPQVRMRRPNMIWHWYKVEFEQYWLHIRL